jgi:hypothetical protein
VGVRHADKLHRRQEIAFTADDERDVTLFRSPAVWLRFAFSQDSGLIFFRQSNVAMTATVDVHEHNPADEEGIVMDAGGLALGDSGQAQDALP